MRIAILSNVTVDFLSSMVGKTADVYTSSGFDTWQQDIIIDRSGLYDFKPEAVFVLLYADAYPAVWSDIKEGKDVIDDWCGVFEVLSKRLPGVPIFVSSIDINSPKCAFGAETKSAFYFEDYLVKEIEKLHLNGASIYVLPVKESIMEIGREQFYSKKMWYLGSMPYSMKGLNALNNLICRYSSVIKGMHKKCLAVDLDNTLWGGVIGEDGVSGIVLSNNKEGARYKDTQRLLKKMKDQGVMLAILSKNNVEDVEPVFSHPDMVLKHEDFVAEVINWNPKSANIRQLAADLNIGLDAFVFLDDNPAEREQMKAACPEVAVIEFPKDSSQLPDVVAAAYDEYFLSLEVTGEDLKKTAMYRAESQRKAEMNSATSVADFLKKLEMNMDIHLIKHEEEKRVTQLTNKTNQFNVTTHRYSEEEIHNLASGSDSDIVTVHMSDKYGDQGLVAVLILKYHKNHAEIDTFLMSCRVMGRNAENEILSQIKAFLIGKGIDSVSATYIKTAKNAPVKELFENLGFNLLSGDANEIGECKTYECDVANLPESTGLFLKTKAFN